MTKPKAEFRVKPRRKMKSVPSVANEPTEEPIEEGLDAVFDDEEADDAPERDTPSARGTDALSRYFVDLQSRARVLSAKEERALARDLREAMSSFAMALVGLAAALLKEHGDQASKSRTCFCRACAALRVIEHDGAKPRKARERMLLAIEDRAGTIAQTLMALAKEPEEGERDLRAGTAIRSRAKACLRSFADYDRLHQAFCSANLRLVISIARKFNFGRLSLGELIQEGNVGLIKAACRYDGGRGYKFSTYGSWWIRHAISRALADKGRMIRLPVCANDKLYRIRKAQAALTVELGRMPTDVEVAERVKMSVRTVSQLVGIGGPLRSLDANVGHDGAHTLGETIEDEQPEPTEGMEAAEDILELHQAIAELKPFEQEIIRRRFGLSDGGEEETLKQIGDSSNLSRERIRQIEEQAKRKLRRAMQKRGLGRD